MLGAGDLRASLGLPLRNVPGQAGHPSFVAEVEKLVVAAARHKLPLIMAPAFHSSADPAAAASLRRFKIAPGHRSSRQDLALAKEALASEKQERDNRSMATPPDSDTGEELAKE
ncbi:hypothetical protein MY11210_000516 [Beauveria gryllotalpidicola]